MKKTTKIKDLKFPVVVQKDEGGWYFVQCPVLDGCFTQGKTIDEALKNIKEVIEMCLEEKETRESIEDYFPKEVSFHNVVLSN